MNILFILSAPSGSGKTTISDAFVRQYHAEYISFDEMNLRSHSDLIEPIKQLLDGGKSVVVDALNDREKYRKEILQAVSKYSCKKILVCLTTPLEECLRRNEKREGKAKLPVWVIEHIYEKYEVPTLDEGWDEILYY